MLHDPNHILWFCDQAVLLKNGRTLDSGAPENVMTGAALTELYGGACSRGELAGGLPWCIRRFNSIKDGPLSPHMERSTSSAHRTCARMKSRTAAYTLLASGTVGVSAEAG